MQPVANGSDDLPINGFFMNKNLNNEGSVFHIQLKETLKASDGERFGDFSITRLSNGETLLAGRFLDQAALRGFLNYLWDLNFTVLYLKKMDEPTNIEIKPG